MTDVDLDVESPRRTLVRRLVTTVVIIVCIGLLVVAAQHTQRGDKEEPTFTGNAKRNEGIVELQAPTPESNVLSQAQITLDLNIDYDATLRVDDEEIPTDQLVKRPELAQISFTPGPGKVFEKLPQGRVCVVATVFRIDGVQEDPHIVDWCFNVT